MKATNKTRLIDISQDREPITMHLVDRPFIWVSNDKKIAMCDKNFPDVKLPKEDSGLELCEGTFHTTTYITTYKVSSYVGEKIKERNRNILFDQLERKLI